MPNLFFIVLIIGYWNYEIYVSRDMVKSLKTSVINNWMWWWFSRHCFKWGIKHVCHYGFKLFWYDFCLPTVWNNIPGWSSALFTENAISFIFMLWSFFFKQIFNGVFLKVNKATMNMLHRVEPYVTYGCVCLSLSLPHWCYQAFIEIVCVKLLFHVLLTGCTW